MPQGLPFKDSEAHGTTLNDSPAEKILQTDYTLNTLRGRRLCFRRERGTVKEWLNNNLDVINTHLHPQQFQGFGLEKQQKHKQTEQDLVECIL